MIIGKIKNEPLPDKYKALGYGFNSMYNGVGATVYRGLGAPLSLVGINSPSEFGVQLANKQAFYDFKLADILEKNFKDKPIKKLGAEIGARFFSNPLNVIPIMGASRAALAMPTVLRAALASGSVSGSQMAALYGLENWGSTQSVPHKIGGSAAAFGLGFVPGAIGGGLLRRAFSKSTPPPVKKDAAYAEMAEREVEKLFGKPKAIEHSSSPNTGDGAPGRYVPISIDEDGVINSVFKTWDELPVGD